MKMIKVSDATYRAIAEETIAPFHSTGTREPDGSWLVPLADDTWERLQMVRHKGESDDDTIMRIIRQRRGQKPN